MSQYAKTTEKEINDCIKKHMFNSGKANFPVKENSKKEKMEILLESLGEETEKEYQAIYNKKRRMVAIQSGILVSEDLKMSNFGNIGLPFLTLIFLALLNFMATVFLTNTFNIPNYLTFLLFPFNFLLPGYFICSQNRISTNSVRQTIEESKEEIKYQLLQRKIIKESDLKIIKDTYGKEFLLQMFGDKENVFYTDFFRVKSVYDKIDRIKNNIDKI